MDFGLLVISKKYKMHSALVSSLYTVQQLEFGCFSVEGVFPNGIEMLGNWEWRTIKIGRNRPTLLMKEPPKHSLGPFAVWKGCLGDEAAITLQVKRTLTPRSRPQRWEFYSSLTQLHWMLNRSHPSPAAPQLDIAVG
jgi:hypothetical protein